MDYLLEYGTTLREWALFGPISVVLVWEVLYPRRERKCSILMRWFSNLSIAVLNGAVLRWVFPFVIIGVAALAQERGWGLLNRLDLPYFARLVICILLLDYCAYLLHRFYHAVPVFWRFHRMHHTDQDVDWTTGVRFHPFESLITTGVMLMLVVTLGMPPEGVLIFEALVLFADVFQHSNITLPLGIERWLRCVVVTPDMHRVHHSVIRVETDSNYGVVFSWWDRLSKTYRREPEGGHTGMRIGLTEFSSPRHINLFWMLALPFLSGDPPNSNLQLDDTLAPKRSDVS